MVIFWYEQRELSKINEAMERCVMSYNYLKPDNYNKIAVVNISDKNYYYALYDDDVKINDYVVVSGTCKEIVRISDIIEKEENNYNYITAEVICKEFYYLFEKIRAKTKSIRTT